MTIAVTGARGLLGRAVIRELLGKGLPVREINRSPGPIGDDTHEVITDLCDAAATVRALEGCHAVVHLAALATPHAAERKTVYDNNVIAASNVLFAAADLGIRRVVYASSQSILGLPWSAAVREPDYVPVDEDHPCRPAFPSSPARLWRRCSAGGANSMYGVCAIPSSGSMTVSMTASPGG